MKRVLALLSVVCALLLAGACHYDINLSVEASADVTYRNGSSLHIDPAPYGGFHHNTLSDSDLEWIFTDLTQHIDPDFNTAILYLKVYDEIAGKYLRDETYGVVFNSFTGHFDFADMNVVY